MRNFSLFLKITALGFLVAGALHLIFGVNAEVMLGAKIPISAITNPALDSQNRFYGTAFTLYGVLLYFCSTDLKKYELILRIVLWVYFIAGMARLVSIAVYGIPPPLVLALMASEILPPPLIFWWMAKLKNTDNFAHSP